MKIEKGKIGIYILLIGLIGCGAPIVNLEEKEEFNITPGDYEKILERWTRNATVVTLDGMETSLTISASYKSYQFIKAYYVRYVDDFRLNQFQREELWKKLMHSYKQWNEFVVAATSSNLRWVKFDSPNSPWNITLLNDKGVELLPSEIEPIKSPPPTMKQYFPYITIFRRVFIIRFPKRDLEQREVISPQVSYFELRFSGALGHTSLVWKTEHK